MPTGISSLDKYLELVQESEPATIVNIWAFLGAAAAAVSGKIYLPFGEKWIFPHMYIIFYGSPASRKSTALNTAMSVLDMSGYTKKLGTSTSFNTMYESLHTYKGVKHGESVFDGGMGEDYVHDCLVYADELTNFIPQGPKSKLATSALGTLWDAQDHTIFSGGMPHSISNPCLTIMAGTTPEGYADALGNSAQATGFASRLIILVCERANKRITIPKPLDGNLRAEVARCLGELHMKSGKLKIGPVEISPEAHTLLDKIYNIDSDPTLSWKWRNYVSRRFTHLLKLCVLLCGIELQHLITPAIVRKANSILHYTESLLHRADLEQSATSGKTIKPEKTLLHIMSNTPGKVYTTMEVQKILGPSVTSSEEGITIISKLINTETIKMHTSQTESGRTIQAGYYFPQPEILYHSSLLDSGIESLLRGEV
jgi:Protein of unknown function (DUF3987)